MTQLSNDAAHRLINFVSLSIAKDTPVEMKVVKGRHPDTKVKYHVDQSNIVWAESKFKPELNKDNNES